MDSVEKKSQQLGMPFGTAQHRLRKAVFFALLMKHGENICMRCGQPIFSVDEISLDHKTDWLDADTALFWDVGNVGVSHLRCNRTGKRPNKKIAPEGLSWCSGCKDFLPEERFFRKTQRWSGVDHYCKKCRAARRKS